MLQVVKCKWKLRGLKRNELTETVVISKVRTTLRRSSFEYGVGRFDSRSGHACLPAASVYVQAL
jgi:hypothetical protein